MTRLLIVTGIICMLAGCAIPTVIKSKPEGATVYIDDVKMGNTPLTYSDTEILLSQKNIRLEMDGYESYRNIIKKDKLKIGPLVGACLVVVPGFWALGYAEEYNVELKRGHSLGAIQKSAPVISESVNQPKAIQAEKPVAQTSDNNSKSSIKPQDTATSSTTFIVIENKTKLRKKPSAKGEVVKSLKKGEEVQLIKEKAGWCLVELAGGETGWCLKGSLDQVN